MAQWQIADREVKRVHILRQACYPESCCRPRCLTRSPQSPRPPEIRPSGGGGHSCPAVRFKARNFWRKNPEKSVSAQDREAAFSARTSLLCFALLCFSLCLCLCLRYLPGKSMGSASGQSLLAGIRFGIILWMSDEANVARDFALRDLWRRTSMFCRLYTHCGLRCGVCLRSLVNSADSLDGLGSRFPALV